MDHITLLEQVDYTIPKQVGCGLIERVIFTMCITHASLLFFCHKELMGPAPKQKISFGTPPLTPCIQEAKYHFFWSGYFLVEKIKKKI